MRQRIVGKGYREGGQWVLGVATVLGLGSAFSGRAAPGTSQTRIRVTCIVPIVTTAKLTGGDGSGSSSDVQVTRTLESSAGSQAATINVVINNNNPAGYTLTLTAYDGSDNLEHDLSSSFFELTGLSGIASSEKLDCMVTLGNSGSPLSFNGGTATLSSQTVGLANTGQTTLPVNLTIPYTPSDANYSAPAGTYQGKLVLTIRSGETGGGSD